MKIYLEVKIDYKDDTSEVFKCSDTPYFGSDFITLTPFTNPMDRFLIPKEAVARVFYTHKAT